MVSLDAAYPTVALVETKHTKDIRGCIYQTTKTLVISKSKNARPTLGLLNGCTRHQLKYAIETIVEHKEYTRPTNQLRNCNWSSVKQRQSPCRTI